MTLIRRLEWTAGFLEGEGTFYYALNHARVSAEQVQLEPLERLKRYFGGFITKRSNRNTSLWVFSCSKSVGLMMTLFPLMSPKRQKQILVVLRKWKSGLGKGHNSFKTHCKRGHPFDSLNTVIIPRGRACRTCKRMFDARVNARRKLMRAMVNK